MLRNVDAKEDGMLVFQALDVAVFGHHVTTEEMLRDARERFGITSKWKKGCLFLKIVYVSVYMCVYICYFFLSILFFSVRLVS